MDNNTTAAKTLAAVATVAAASLSLQPGNINILNNLNINVCNTKVINNNFAFREDFQKDLWDTEMPTYDRSKWGYSSILNLYTGFKIEFKELHNILKEPDPLDESDINSGDYEFGLPGDYELTPFGQPLPSFYSDK